MTCSQLITTCSGGDSWPAAVGTGWFASPDSNCRSGCSSAMGVLSDPRGHHPGRLLSTAQRVGVGRATAVVAVCTQRTNDAYDAGGCATTPQPERFRLGEHRARCNEKVSGVGTVHD